MRFFDVCVFNKNHTLLVPRPSLYLYIQYAIDALSIISFVQACCSQRFSLISSRIHLPGMVTVELRSLAGVFWREKGRRSTI